MRTPSAVSLRDDPGVALYLATLAGIYVLGLAIV